MEFPHYTSGTDFVQYNRGLAIDIHGDDRRLNGTLYITHPEEVARFCGAVCREPEDVAVAVAWSHDIVEESLMRGSGVDVASTRRYTRIHDEKAEPARRFVFYNDMVSEAGQLGSDAAYILNRVSKRPGETKEDMMARVYSVSTIPGVIMNNDRRSLLVKVLDRISNTPEAEYVDMGLALSRYETMMQSGDSQSGMKTAFADLYDVPVSILTQAEWENVSPIIKDEFENKRRRIAGNNLELYFPIAERMLLLQPGIVNSHYDESKAMDDTLFLHPELRELFASGYRNSLLVLGGGSINEERIASAERGRHVIHPGEVPGYRTVLEQIREEVLASA